MMHVHIYIFVYMIFVGTQDPCVEHFSTEFGSEAFQD